MGACVVEGVGVRTSPTHTAGGALARRQVFEAHAQSIGGSFEKGGRDASPYQCFGKQQQQREEGANRVLRPLPTLPRTSRNFSARRSPGVTSRGRLTDEDARATVLGKL